MLVRDIMTKNPLTAHLNTSVFDAARTLESEEIRHLPIVENGELVGIVSDRDIGRFTHAALVQEPDQGKRRLQMPISEIMSGDPVSVEADDDVDDAIDAMLENRVGALPVVSPEGALLGIVSYVDVLRAARGRL